MQARVVVDAVVGVDDAGIGGVADHDTAEEVRGHRDVEHVVPAATGEAVDALRHPPYRVVPGRDPRGVRLAVPLLRRELAPEQTTFRVARDRVVSRLHHEGDDRLLGPALHAHVARELYRMARDLFHPGEEPHTLPTVCERRRQQAHRIAPLAVTHWFDVCVGVGMERRRDRDTLREVCVLAERARAEDRLRVRARELPESPGQLRQVSLVAHPMQELLRAHRSCGEDHVARAETLAFAATGRDGLDNVSVAVGPHRTNGRHRIHDRTGLLREIQIVLEQRVLGAVPAPRHALAALDTTFAFRSGAAEERVVDLDARRTEEDTHRRRVERVADAHILGDVFHHFVRRRDRRVGNDAEHPFRLVVVRRELRTPVGDVCPLRIGIEGIERLVQRVRVHERSAPDACTRQDHHVLQQ